MIEKKRSANLKREWGEPSSCSEIGSFNFCWGWREETHCNFKDLLRIPGEEVRFLLKNNCLELPPKSINLEIALRPGSGSSAVEHSTAVIRQRVRNFERSRITIDGSISGKCVQSAGLSIYECCSLVRNVYRRFVHVEEVLMQVMTWRRLVGCSCWLFPGKRREQGGDQASANRTLASSWLVEVWHASRISSLLSSQLGSNLFFDYD